MRQNPEIGLAEPQPHLPEPRTVTASTERVEMRYGSNLGTISTRDRRDTQTVPLTELPFRWIALPGPGFRHQVSGTAETPESAVDDL